MNEEHKSILIGCILIFVSVGVIAVISFFNSGEKQKQNESFLSDMESVEGFNQNVSYLLEKIGDRESYHEYEDIKKYRDKIEKLNDDYAGFSDDQKEKVDEEKYNELLEIRKFMGIKMASAKSRDAMLNSLDMLTSIFDEKLPDKKYYEKAQQIIELFNSIDDAKKHDLKSYDKIQRILAKCDKIDDKNVKKTIKLINKIGKVKYNKKTKKKILAAGKSYYALRSRAKDKVTNADVFFDKRDEYYKLEKEAIGYNKDLFGKSGTDPKEVYEEQKYYEENAFSEDGKNSKSNGANNKERNVDPDDYDDGGDYADDAWGDDYDDWDDAYEAWEDEGW